MAALTTTHPSIIVDVENKIRRAMTEGVPGVSSAVMTPTDYTPNSPGVSPNIAQDTNRALAAGIIEGIASFPVRLPRFTVTNIPTAALWVGALVYVANGAAGQPIVAFSNGSAWIRVDTGTAIS